MFLKRFIPTALGALAFVAIVIFSAHAYEPPSHDAKGWVWVPGHHDTRGAWIMGFYREPVRAGDIWIDPFSDEFGLNVPGHWVKEAPADAGYLWEPGHRGDEDEWVQGFWRRSELEGFQWVTGTYDDEGDWISGQWRPIHMVDDYTWVPGDVDRTQGCWRVGFWRLSSRDDLVWHDAYWADGYWYSAHWAPLKARAEFIWVPGHVNNNNAVWVKGYWRPLSKKRHSWVPGHWYRGMWIAAHWVRGYWSQDANVRIKRYAHYDPHRGHAHKTVHKKIRHIRYVSYRPTKPVIVKPKPVEGTAAAPIQQPKPVEGTAAAPIQKPKPVEGTAAVSRSALPAKPAPKSLQAMPVLPRSKPGSARTGVRMPPSAPRARAVPQARQARTAPKTRSSPAARKAKRPVTPRTRPKTAPRRPRQPAPLVIHPPEKSAKKRGKARRKQKQRKRPLPAKVAPKPRR